MKFDQVGFIGGGKMAQALASGMVGKQIFRSDQVVVSDPHQATLDQFLGNFPGSVGAADNIQLVKKCDLIILAVKPQKLLQSLVGIKGAVSGAQLWMSVVAGIRIRRLAELIGSQRIIRVMPNTPCLIRQGASGIAAGQNANPDDMACVEQICNGIGCSVQVSEEQLDAVTGLSGSGPAYVFTFIDALIDGGLAMGLTRADASKLAVQTVLGAASLVDSTGQSPADLRNMVTSPGGTTIAGLRALEDGAFRALVMGAVEAACEGSRELGSS